MTTLLKTFLVALLLLSGQPVLASPRADARFIVQRELDPDNQEFLQGLLKRAFATVYARPFKERGIRIIDSGKLADLVPDEDIAPYVDRFLSQTIELYLSIFTPEQLAFIAEILRKDKTASLQEILSEEFRQDYLVALEQARATAQTSGSTDPTVLALEEAIIHLDAFNKVLEENGEAIGQDIAVSMAPLFTIIRYTHEIQGLHREFDNPVSIAALQTDGIFKFANPVQRQTLLRELSEREERSGIRFIKPPSRRDGSN